MNHFQLTRRAFCAATAGAALAGGSASQAAAFKGKLRKAMIIGDVTEKALTPLKEAGFDGVESSLIVPEEVAVKAKGIADSMGMRIHSVLLGWMDFNSDDPAKVEASMEKVRRSLRAAKGYGADAVLVVPCRTGVKPLPEAWEFEIAFDEKTGHVTEVVKGDNSKYEAYIKAQNEATDRSKLAVEKLIPMAEDLKVVIALENVWNNLWVKPALYKHFVASFKSPWIKSYFDIGNHVKYAPPQDWIHELGGLIAKLHFKDFKLNPDGHGGKFVHPRDGSIDWPAVRRALDEVGYDGWGSIEDGGLPLPEFAKRFDMIAAGE